MTESTISKNHPALRLDVAPINKEHSTMTSKTSRHAKKMPAATPEQRKAMTFPALKVSFEHTNDDWAITYLPRVRLATLILQRDDMVLEKLRHLAT
jgi:hypothetical protein